MNVFAHNFNPKSNSGPNKFTRQLFRSLINDNLIKPVSNPSEADIEFFLIQQQQEKLKPAVLRLDGIYFNSSQDYNTQNKSILHAYNNANAVIFQSEFNKKLTEKWFGNHKNGHVIHNAPDLEVASRANPDFWNTRPQLPSVKKGVDVWSCASSWRPHKRLKDNIRYFIEMAEEKSILLIAGDGAKDSDFSDVKDLLGKRIFYLGNLDYITLLSLYKRSSTFIHLAYLDHCPNVVVDALACNCHVVCSSAGGTKELVNKGKGTVIIEKDWDFSPIELYNPPALDFSSYLVMSSKEPANYDIGSCANMYYSVFKSVLNA